MKVVRVKFRTPGVYLKNPIELRIEVAREGTEDWKSIEDVQGITVLADTTRPDENGKGIFEGEVGVQSIIIPHVGESENTVDLLMEDGQRWKYRILALACFDCAQIFRQKVVTGPDYPDWTVNVGEGIIES